MSSLEDGDTPGGTRRGTAVGTRPDESAWIIRDHGCRLGVAAGRVLRCDDTCALWEAGGAVVPPGCLLDRVPLDLRTRPEPTRLLVELKERLERDGPARERRAAHAELASVVERAVTGRMRR